MGTWNATIFGNDTSIDVKEEFFERYNKGEEPIDIKNELLLNFDDEDRFNVMFALAHCMWETGSLDNDFLFEVKKAIQSKDDLSIAKELGADDEFLKQRSAYLFKFLEKISTKKNRPKKRVAPPVPIESKYKNGAVMVFQYVDGMWGALISLNGQFFDKKTIYHFVQTTVKMSNKPSMDDVLKSYIIDINFHNTERNSYPVRSPFFYYCFDNCISYALTAKPTKNFEHYNDSFFEIIGYLSDWGNCTGGIFNVFYYNQKSSEEFCEDAGRLLTTVYDKQSNLHTEMMVEEINQEFIFRQQKNNNTSINYNVKDNVHEKMWKRIKEKFLRKSEDNI